MNDTLTYALDLAQRGYHLFPLINDGKTPALTGNWQKAATRDPRVLQRWFARTNCNIAIACEPSGIFAIDLDTAKPGVGGPAHGIETLRELADGRDLPRTLTVATPSGGTHLYFRQPVDGSPLRNTARRLGPLIDTRGVGGYLVAPGSQVNGVAYRITDDVPLAEIPDWVTTLLRPPEAVAGQQSHVVRPIPAGIGSPYALAALGRETARVAAAKLGQRNDTLNRAAYSLGRLISDGVLDRAQVENQLGRAAQASGLSRAETETTLDSGITAGLRRNRSDATGAPSTPDPSVKADRFAWATPVETRLNPAAAELPTSQPDRTALPSKTLAALHAAFDALEQELGEPSPAHGHAARPDSKQDSDHPLSPEDAADLLDQAVATVQSIEPRAAALARTPEWHKIRAIGRASADLTRQVRQAIRDHADDLRIDIYVHGAIRTIAGRACRQIGELASVAADRLADRGLTDSPTYADLRAVHRAAHRAEAKLTGRAPGQPEPEQHTAARKQLKQLRCDLRTKPRGCEPVQAPKTAMRAAACPQSRR
jgi:Bifunctional DNA primase/polymerase, N-terminal